MKVTSKKLAAVMTGLLGITLNSHVAAMGEDDPLLISWWPVCGRTTMRIELLMENGDLCSTIAAFARDTGEYSWDAVGLCDDMSRPGTYRIRVTDIYNDKVGVSNLLTIEDCQ